MIKRENKKIQISRSFILSSQVKRTGIRSKKSSQRTRPSPAFTPSVGEPQGNGRIVGSLLKREYDLWILLNHTRHAIYRLRELELNQYGITVEQARLLFVVNTLGNKAVPTEIARYLFRESHTISSLIGRMEKKEMVKRVKDLDNKKFVNVILTKKGQEILKKTMVMDSLHDIMSGLSQEQQIQLEFCLETLISSAIQQINDKNRLSKLDHWGIY
jgi:DNA-binding MarR family transcriptional regulator